MSILAAAPVDDQIVCSLAGNHAGCVGGGAVERGGGVHKSSRLKAATLRRSASSAAT